VGADSQHVLLRLDLKDVEEIADRGVDPANLQQRRLAGRREITHFDLVGEGVFGDEERHGLGKAPAAVDGDHGRLRVRAELDRREVAGVAGGGDEVDLAHGWRW
jgi:hypothetical protein